jgi:hypothetical protein
MSVWGDNPEWFDEWLEKRALEGRFGLEVQARAEAGDFEAYMEWNKLDPTGELGTEATQDYWERRMSD